MQIFHNPRCRKSRETLQLLKEKGVSLEIILYLQEVPDKATLRSILEKLNISAEQLIRKNEAIYKEKYKGLSLSDEQWIEAMISHPKLIERPIVIHGDKAIIGRPPQNVLSIL